MIEAVEFRNVVLKNGLKISDDQVTKLLLYSNLLLEWNQKINLISRRDQENIIEQHILASISPLFKFEFERGASILDLGTGGGLPGIPLAILCPENKFTLLDSIQKKIKALTEMMKELNLSNVTATARRAEELSGLPNNKGVFGYVTSRATASVSEIIKWGRPFLGPHADNISAPALERQRRPKIPAGALVLYKGGDISGEIEDAKRNEKPAGITIHDLTIDGINESHFHDKKLVIIYP